MMSDSRAGAIPVEPQPMPTARPDTYLPWMIDPGRSSQTEISGPVAAVATSPDSLKLNLQPRRWQTFRRSHRRDHLLPRKAGQNEAAGRRTLRVSSQSIFSLLISLVCHRLRSRDQGMVHGRADLAVDGPTLSYYPQLDSTKGIQSHS